MKVFRDRWLPVLIGLGLVVVLLVPLLTVGYINRAHVRTAMAQQGEDERLNSATITARMVDEILRAADSDLRSIATRATFREALARGDAAGLVRHLQDLKNASFRYNSAGVIDPGGLMVGREPAGGIIGQSFADRDYFKGALTLSGPYVSEAFVSRVDQLPLIAVALRVTDGVMTLGVLNVTIAAREFIALASGLRGVQGRQIMLIDRSARVVASSADLEPLATVPLTPSMVPGATDVSLGEREYLAAYVPITNASWTLYVLDDPVRALAVARELEDNMTVAFDAMVAVIGLLGLVTGWLVAQRRRATRQMELAYGAQRVANEQLRRVDRGKDEFVSIVSHEFRTPLTGILGFSEMIRDQASLTTDEVKEFAGDIHKNAARLARMINDLLDLDRMRLGRMTLDIGPVDLNAIVRDVAALIPRDPVLHQIELELDDAIPRAQGDKDKLTQVVTNLVSNAVKYSPEGGPIRLRSWLEGDTFRLSVADSGIGIPAGELDRVFEKFTRVESKAMRDIQGTGLGLPIVRQIVELHGGRVWVESVFGAGSTFHVALPLAPTWAPIPTTSAA